MNTARYLTDEEIIGDLRKRILAKPLQLPPMGEVTEAKIKQPVVFAGVKEYKRAQPPKPHRVPRKWWGWIIPVVHRLDEALKEV